MTVLTTNGSQKVISSTYLTRRTTFKKTAPTPAAGSTYPGSSGQSALTTSTPAAVLNSFPPTHHSLYEELLFQIKSLLTSSRKGDPLCCINGFDTIHFEGLARRGVLCKTNRGQVYALPTLTKLDDILGAQWYVRGINTAGDFCYVQPKTVK